MNSYKRKVVIIDEEQDLCHILKNYFLQGNDEVYIAHSIKDGEYLIRSKQPDILFLDNNLPDGEGWANAPEFSNTVKTMFIAFMSAFHPNIPSMPEHSKYCVLEKPLSIANLDQHFKQA